MMIIGSNWRRISLSVIMPLLVVSACQTGAPSEALTYRSKQAPTTLIVAIAKNAQKCWFKSGDTAFKSFRLANEVNSHSGRPRILLVPKSNPGGLPSLVIQAEKKGTSTTGTFTRMQTYGPLLATPNGKRVTNDVKRWSSGNKNCSA